MNARADLGVIGGSGMYDMQGLHAVRKVKVHTPFGDPSDSIILGELEGRRLAFLPRHGVGHRILPSELNFRANIFAMKLLGVRQIVSLGAVGSMKESIQPGHMVVPDQFFDRTLNRPRTFFGDGVVVHINFADPLCSSLGRALGDAAAKVGATVHRGGTYICIEGPQFSTRAESKVFRSWGVDVIGMTNLSEARLAREAEICYATLALVTDYDCWHETEEDVNIESVLRILKQNAETAKSIVKAVAAILPEAAACSCGSALKNAIITDPKRIPASTRRSLAPLIGKYLPKPRRKR
ncbi:MAG: S-methyl-5'-thioadenosine phosphorylase [Nitrospirae bacterium]|nr:S-methyl-5'-thioadenosine phosphorylase [Nitrospirota bacterium]